ncbi:MAG: MCP four helix bundle domain-containing protein [Bacteroidales bacterium]|nr:MCP four helix bundle domain-containing protein [Bacteroidales bacterium]
MKIRLKILSGFLVIVAMLTIAGGFGIYEFRRLSNSVESILTDNYASIVACNSMLEGLEREDSGILLFMMGQHELGKVTILDGDSIFKKSLQSARNNITEKDEEVYIEEISKKYEIYKKYWEYQVANEQETFDMDWFFQNVHYSFNDVKTAVKGLMMLNQTSMYNEAFMLREKAQRAVMPGFVAVVAALIFAVLFNFFINHYFVSPILRLIRAINLYHPSGRELDAKIETQDEIKTLEEAVRNMILKFNRKMI